MSILPDFEYDIFISYRHNDNKSGWVTEFVKALQEELAATIKEPVSVYFDSNPHDGLLETHNVDKSLEGKLKCLIFIPILSQTYCDPKSFAWQHEFVAFNRMAREDQFGRDIKLTGGNVTSRILPIKIHDLDTEDKSVIESEIGGVLRAIDFIYKESGVNRPLKSSDNKTDNQNKTDYRNQVNKVANAIKEIIVALKNPVTQNPSSTNNPVPIPIGSYRDQPSTHSAKSKTKIILSGVLVLALLLAGYFLYLKLLPSTNDVTLDRSIAVLPFVNMSNDPSQEYFSDGISEEILNLLAKIPELKVIGRTSSFYFKGKNEDLRGIGEKLGAAHLLEGSVRKEGNKIRITAQLIRASDGVHLWSDTYDRKLENIFDLQDEIAAAVLKQLKLKLLGTSAFTSASNVSSEVYNLMLKGNYFADQRNTTKAYEYYSQALALDSSSARIWSSMAFIKILEGNSSFQKFQSNFSQARVFAEKALGLDSKSSEAHRVKGLIYMWYDFDWKKADAEFNQTLEMEPGNSNALRNYGQLKRVLGLYEEALELNSKSLAINPLNVVTITNQADALSTLTKYDEAIKILYSGTEFNRETINAKLVELYLISGKYDLIQKPFSELSESDKIRLAPMVWFALGQKEKMTQAEREMVAQHNNKVIGSFDVAVSYAFMQHKNLALDYLEKSVD